MSRSPRPTPSFSLTPRQIEVRDTVLASGASDCLIYGGARSTKTFLLCYAIATRALMAPMSRHLISRLHHVDVRKSVMMDTWPKMMRLAYPGVPYKEHKADQFFTLPNGSEVWCGGLDDKERVEKVLGNEYATIYINEASQVSYETVLTVLTRLAQNVENVDGAQLPLRFYADLNPVGRGHWTHRMFIDGVDPVNGTKLPEGGRRCAVMNPTDNPHLPAETLARYAALPSRQRQRFYEGQYLSEVPGALWPLDTIETLRVVAAPELTRIVVAVDPSGSDGTGGDSQGIIVAGVGVDGHAYLLADRSCRLSPDGWARRAVNAYHEFHADILIGEINYGGAMVEYTIKTVDGGVNYKTVTASRGKHIRAEPVAALYETATDDAGKTIRAGRVHHVGAYPDLEEQMGMMTTTGYQGSGSPDRLDALVWALTELMLEDNAQGWLDYYKEEVGKLDGKPVTEGVHVAVLALEQPEAEPEVALKIRLRVPPNVDSLDLSNGHTYRPDAERFVFVVQADVDMLVRAGCART